VIEHLPSMCEVQGSTSITTKKRKKKKEKKKNQTQIDIFKRSHKNASLKTLSLFMMFLFHLLQPQQHIKETMCLRTMKKQNGLQHQK
jgi:hypothetical protein